MEYIHGIIESAYAYAEHEVYRLNAMHATVWNMPSSEKNEIVLERLEKDILTQDQEFTIIYDILYGPWY